MALRVLAQIVSKKKVRYQQDGFDLDLTYITPRIIALGAPCEGGEGMYRNPISEVQRFLALKHRDRFRIYDLRAEKGASYDASRFGGTEHAAAFRFFDHNPAPISLICRAVEDMMEWLNRHPENVVAVHCEWELRAPFILLCTCSHDPRPDPISPS
jgi:phosphatidylinositol-3,4,5-trisphosphate 3-phosphatase/dual-specificity protein phosphatase PTEN